MDEEIRPDFKGMDLLHRSDDYQFISDEFEVKAFYESAKKCIENVSYDAEMSESDDFADKMQCEPNVVDELRRTCNVDLLKCGDEDEQDPLSSIIPSGSTLMTTEIQQRELEKRSVLSYRQMQVQLQKFKRINFKILDSYRDEAEKKLIVENFQPDDVLITIYFTKPYNKPLERHEIRLGRLLSMDSAFYVLGNQKLTDLRDKINCLSDWGVLQDYSEDPGQAQDVLTKDRYKSGFFYINGTFYNDLRDPSSVDLSQNVIDWALKRPREIGPMQKADMNETRFMDLKLRLGQPYLYLHQGTCEHLIIFTDIRLLHPKDCLNPKEYPMQISYKMKKRAACCLCKVYTSRWVTFGNDNLPFDPGFFCDTCFFSFNYDKKGRKRGTFRAIPYFDRSVL